MTYKQERQNEIKRADRALIRAVIGVSLFEKGLLDLINLRREVNERLESARLGLLALKDLDDHLRFLESKGLVGKDNDGDVRLTGQGEQFFKEIVSPPASE